MLVATSFLQSIRATLLRCFAAAESSRGPLALFVADRETTSFREPRPDAAVQGETPRGQTRRVAKRDGRRSAIDGDSSNHPARIAATTESSSCSSPWQRVGSSRPSRDAAGSANEPARPPVTRFASSTLTFARFPSRREIASAAASPARPPPTMATSIAAGSEPCRLRLLNNSFPMRGVLGGGREVGETSVERSGARRFRIVACRKRDTSIHNRAGIFCDSLQQLSVGPPHHAEHRTAIGMERIPNPPTGIEKLLGPIHLVHHQTAKSVVTAGLKQIVFGQSVLLVVLPWQINSAATRIFRRRPAECSSIGMRFHSRWQHRPVAVRRIPTRANRPNRLPRPRDNNSVPPARTYRTESSVDPLTRHRQSPTGNARVSRTAAPYLARPARFHWRGDANRSATHGSPLVGLVGPGHRGSPPAQTADRGSSSRPQSVATNQASECAAPGVRCSRPSHRSCGQRHTASTSRLVWLAGGARTIGRNCFRCGAKCGEQDDSSFES